MKFIISAIFICAVALVNGQANTGVISGTIYDALDSTTIIPFAKVWVDSEGGPVAVLSDANGKYKISGLKPGVYNVHTKSIGFDLRVIGSVPVKPDEITSVLIFCGSNNILPKFDVFPPPILIREIPKINIPLADIERSLYIRDPLELLTTSTSDIIKTEGTDELIIRGSRPGDAIYYLDGVKSTNMSSVPGVAIGSLQAYTGGIPAKYGDTMGGVVILETKSYFDLYRAWKAQQN